uniref:Transmembrane protein n=1 Tax=Strongyloides stercoralis TaxID=6248 RepID=A0A0K0E9N0_STRER
MLIFLILLLFFQTVNSMFTIKMKQDDKCNLKYIQFLDPTLEEVIININGLENIYTIQKELITITFNKYYPFQQLPFMELNIFFLINDKDEVLFMMESDFDNSIKICFGILSIDFFLSYNFNFEFIKGNNTLLDEEDSVVLPKFVQIPYEKSVGYRDEIFIIVIIIAIACYLFLLIFMFCKKGNISEIKENEMNKDKFEYKGNFKKMLENRYKVLKEEPYPPENEIIDLPKWKSRREVLKAIREIKLQGMRHQSNKKKVENKEVKVNKKSKDTMVIKRADDVPAEKIKNKDSNVEIRGITKFSSEVFLNKKNKPRKKRRK